MEPSERPSESFKTFCMAMFWISPKRAVMEANIQLMPIVPVCEVREW